MSRLKVWDINGSVIDLALYGLFGLKLIVPSPSYSETRESIPGRPGSISLGKDLLPRNLVAEFKVTGKDFIDSLLIRDELYQLFSKGNQFYIGESKQPGKRWLVDCTEQWTPERVNRVTMRTSIPLVAESGMAESVGTTLDPFTFDSNLWQIGQGLVTDDLIYKHNQNTFSIYNAGSVEVDPRYIPIKITYKGSSTNLKIRNVTTGDEWSYTGTSNSDDHIVLDRIRSTKNGLSILKDTNKKLITLNPGWNNFILEGTSGTFEITFDFRFYYL